MRAAAVAAMLAAVALALALVPENCRRLDVFVALVLLVSAAGFVLYMPLGVAAGIEQVDLMVLGPLGVLGCAAAVASGAALVAAISGYMGASLALDAVAVGGFAAGGIVLRGGVECR